MVQKYIPTRLSILLCPVCLLICTSLFSTASGEALTDYRPSSQQSSSVPNQTFSGSEIPRIVIKFKELTAVRLRDGSLRSENPSTLPPGITIARLQAELHNIRDILRNHNLRARRHFQSLPEFQLDALEVRGERRSRHELKSLNLYYSVPLPANSAIDLVKGLVEEFKSSKIVETAYAEPSATIGSLEETPDFEPDQGYLDAPPVGIGARTAWTYEGGRGENIRFIDMELAWNPDHDDLPLLFSDSGSYKPDSREIQHGTKVLGVIGGVDNGAGVTGIANLASIGVESSYATTTADAIISAASKVGEGGLVLIELHRSGGPSDGTECTCNTDQCDRLPLEYWDADFSAIQTATTNGVIVVEIAGNGSVDLDSPVFGGAFDRSVRDSGAIMVGASLSDARTPKCWTNFGKRVDVHAWGEGVVSAGGGDLFVGASGSPDTYYTGSFNGTSSAASIVAGGAVSVQGIAYGEQVAFLEPEQMRELLRSTGIPQSGDLDREIGPMPNLEAAIENLPLLNDYGWLPAVYHMSLY